MKKAASCVVMRCHALSCVVMRGHTSPVTTKAPRNAQIDTAVESKPYTHHFVFYHSAQARPAVFLSEPHRLTYAEALQVSVSP
jgi:hypothetical protein